MSNWQRHLVEEYEVNEKDPLLNQAPEVYKLRTFCGKYREEPDDDHFSQAEGSAGQEDPNLCVQSNDPLHQGPRGKKARTHLIYSLAGCLLHSSLKCLLQTYVSFLISCHGH